MKRWVEGKVVGKRQWSETLFTLQLDAAVEKFNAGQFIQVAMDIERERIDRSYSLVNAPHERPLEIYFNEVPEGPLTPRLSDLKPGEQIWVSEKAKGLFTLDRVPESESLWLFATGTALGVYLSILSTKTPWERFEKIMLVYGCRTNEELTYGKTIRCFLDRHGEQFDFIPVLSREKMPDVLHGRITGLLADGTLEARAGRQVHASNAQVMLCGNAEMIGEMRALLESRGLRRNIGKTPGHYTTEQYY